MNPLRLIRLELQQIRTSNAEGRYDLTALNLGGRPVDLRLDAHDESGRLSFALVEEITVPGGSEHHVSVAVTPIQRRFLRRRRTYSFTVSARPSGDAAASQVTIGGEFEDAPTRWPLAAVGAASGLLLIVIAAAALIFARGSSHPSVAAPSNGYAFSARFSTGTNQGSAPPTICYHLAPENVPFHVVLSAWTNGKVSTTLDEWDDDGQGGGDCVGLMQTQPNAPGMMILQAFVNGAKVGEAVLSSLTY